MNHANENALAHLQNVKLNQEIQSLLEAKEKIVHKHLTVIETEIAKCLAELKFKQCENLTGELVRMVTAVVVSTVERYIDLPEDKDNMIETIKMNIDSLYGFMKEQNARAERSAELHEKIAQAESNDGQL